MDQSKILFRFILEIQVEMEIEDKKCDNTQPVANWETLNGCIPINITLDPSVSK